MSDAHVVAIAELEKTTNAAPWSLNSFRGETSNPQAHYVVVLHGKEVVAFGGYWAIVDEAHVTTLAVHPAHRRRGIGRDIMKALLIDAKKRGITCSTLEVRASNETAIALYMELGYVKCGMRKNYYPNDREDAVVMWLYGLQELELGK
jgi:ribosomal-protein-alanine N-acetyltransferase